MKPILKTVIVIGVFSTTNSAFAEQACFDVEGMTCATCTLTLKTAVRRLKGIQDVTASVEKKNTIVLFDTKQTTPDAVKKAIDDVGYKAKIRECKKTEG